MSYSDMVYIVSGSVANVCTRLGTDRCSADEQRRLNAVLIVIMRLGQIFIQQFIAVRVSVCVEMRRAYTNRHPWPTISSIAVYNCRRSHCLGHYIRRVFGSIDCWLENSLFARRDK